MNGVAPDGDDDRMYPEPYRPAYAPPTSGLAVASLIAGIIGALGGCVLCGLPCILAVILGHMATRETRHGARGGHGMAIAGLILGYLFVIPAILFTIQLGIGGVVTLLDESGA